ncbi:MAG TPA: D-alanine--D-alanine ligase, partial [Patescibacteria group bacterium]|nr:D-alanine--D-alanine ligase [Patescibacteria group bacterium]
MKKNIGVFFGSASPEHDVSIVTGQMIIAGLKKLGYPVVPVYLSKDKRWLIGDRLGNIKTFAAAAPGLLFDKGEEQWLLDMEKSAGKLVFRHKGILGKTITIDLAFPALHGSYGEDGTIQG